MNCNSCGVDQQTVSGRCGFCGRGAATRSAPFGEIPDWADSTQLISGRWSVRAQLLAVPEESLYDADDALESARVTLLRGRDDVAARDRLERQFAFVSSVSHPGLPRAVESRADAYEPFIVLEGFDGRALSLAADGSGPAESSASIAALGAQVAEALAAMHLRERAHLALHPGLVGREASGTVRLLTPGLVSRYGTRFEHGQGPGMPALMAPELFLGQPTDGATDVYALGMLLLRLSHGGWPFASQTLDAITHWHLAGERAIRVPGPLGAVIAEAIRHDHHERPSAADLARRLRNLPPSSAGDTTPIAHPRVAVVAPDAGAGSDGAEAPDEHEDQREGERHDSSSPHPQSRRKRGKKRAPKAESTTEDATKADAPPPPPPTDLEAGIASEHSAPKASSASSRAAPEGSQGRQTPEGPRTSSQPPPAEPPRPKRKFRFLLVASATLLGYCAIRPSLDRLTLEDASSDGAVAQAFAQEALAKFTPDELGAAVSLVSGKRPAADDEEPAVMAARAELEAGLAQALSAQASLKETRAARDRSSPESAALRTEAAALSQKAKSHAETARAALFKAQSRNQEDDAVQRASLEVAATGKSTQRDYLRAVRLAAADSPQTRLAAVAFLASKRDQADGAFELLRGLEATGHTSPRTLWLHAQLETARGNPLEARSYARKLLKLTPEHPLAVEALMTWRGPAAALVDKASAELEKGLSAKALSTSQKALGLDPDDTEAMYMNAVALLNLGRRQDGVAMLERSLAITPDDHEALIVLADVLRSTDPERATDAYRRVLRINPSAENRAIAEKRLAELGTAPP